MEHRLFRPPAGQAVVWTQTVREERRWVGPLILPWKAAQLATYEEWAAAFSWTASNIVVGQFVLPCNSAASPPAPRSLTVSVSRR